ncbi:hypothetical protein FO519_001245 [Halicephalobus sp. NKZ332]|nr:hypothetical protein FO519_001245 [Halicephalobus sp. NKZ332]
MEYSVFLKVRTPAGRVLATGEVTIKATFSLQELHKLMNKAIFFCEELGNHKRAFRVVYRCKPKCYWDEIQDSWKGMMLKYIKDENGQSACPINGALYGLFFSAKVLKNGELPPTNPFGDIRMRIPAEDLLDPTKHNMYFADFYCNREVHYVTVAVCVKNSNSDVFCRRKLIYLDPSNNPFITAIDRTRYFEFFTATGVYVEIFYTESVPINLGHFEKVKPVGMGTSRIGGLPHNKHCSICNLYPVPPFEENNNDVEKTKGEEKWRRLDSMVDELRPMGLPWTDCDDVARTLDDLVEKISEEKSTVILREVSGEEITIISENGDVFGGFVKGIRALERNKKTQLEILDTL